MHLMLVDTKNNFRKVLTVTSYYGEGSTQVSLVPDAGIPTCNTALEGQGTRQDFTVHHVQTSCLKDTHRLDSKPERLSACSFSKAMHIHN